MVKAAVRKPVSAASVVDGRVRKPHADHDEQSEMRVYLSKLRQLVPNMPKDRKVSKVEVINNVIDYICDLQDALIGQLHAHPSAAVAAIINNNSMEVVDANGPTPVELVRSTISC